MVRVAITASKRYRRTEVRDALLEIIRGHAQEEIRAKAVGALVAQRDPAVVPALRQQLDNPRTTREELAVLKSTIAYLERLAPPPAPDLEPSLLRRDLAGAVSDKSARRELLHRLIAALNDPVDKVRNQAVKALEQLGDKRAVPALILRLDDPVPGIRQTAAIALGTLGSTRAVPALIRKLEEFSNYRQGMPVLIALGVIGDPRALPALLRVLEQGDWNIVNLIFANGIIAKVANREGLPDIKATTERLLRKTPAQFGIDDARAARFFPDNRVPTGAITGIYHQALARVADARDVPELLRAFDEDPENERLTAALRRLADPRALEPMRRYLAAGNARAAEVLAALGAPGLQALKEGLRHPEQRVREAVVRACCFAGGAELIAQCKDDDALRLLEAVAAHDPHSAIRLYAKGTLSLVHNPQRWRRCHQVDGRWSMIDGLWSEREPIGYGT